MLIQANALALPIASQTIDAIVTDPPYGLGFMGKDWDHGIPGVEFWVEALRVAKPGAHLLAFGGTRTFHRLACAIEDAGWEIRDTIMWVYGSGFPKSLDVSKAIDKAAGAEREVVGVRQYADGTTAHGAPSDKFAQDEWTRNPENWKTKETAPATDAARQWSGWGTALKPAWEPIIVARKPLEGTVASNVQRWATGAINIDGCRIPSGPDHAEKCASVVGLASNRNGACFGEWAGAREDSHSSLGRWPANLIHDGSEDVLALFPQTGVSAGGRIGKKAVSAVNNAPAGQYSKGDLGFSDSGSAARFFYCAKASRSERDVGLEHLTLTRDSDRADDDGPGGDSPRNRTNTAHHNSHPTVKPIALMRYLVRLVTPVGALVLDPFVGSGSTGVAANAEGMRFVGCDLNPAYLGLARARLTNVQHRLTAL